MHKISPEDELRQFIDDRVFVNPDIEFYDLSDVEQMDMLEIIIRGLDEGELCEILLESRSSCVLKKIFLENDNSGILAARDIIKFKMLDYMGEGLSEIFEKRSEQLRLNMEDDMTRRQWDE